MTQAARAQPLSLATRALALSIGLGGISGLVLLPGQIATTGPALLLGFLLGLWLLAYPLFRAEVSAATLHGQPLPLAISAGYAAGFMRPWWSFGLILVFLVLVVLVSLGGVVASWLLQCALLLAQQGSEAPVEALEGLPAAFGATLLCLALFWLLVAAGPGQNLISARELSRAPPWARLGPVAILGAIGALGLIGFPAQWQALLLQAPQSPNTAAALFQGAVTGLFVSGAALGVVYTAACRLEEEGQASRPGLLPALTTGGISLWTLAALGWAGTLQAGNAPAGLDDFLAALLLSSWHPLAKILLCLLLLAVLSLGARVMLDVPLHWLSRRLPLGDSLAGALLSWLCFGLGGFVAFALAQGTEDPLQQWLLTCLGILRGIGLPLAALLLVGLMVRTLPPSAMIWPQGVPLIGAAAFYLYWRYAVRLFLVAVLLTESGVAAIVWNFWTQVPDG